MFNRQLLLIAFEHCKLQNIYLAHYGVECKKVVVKKLRGESNNTKWRFLKEAEMQHKFNVGTLKLFVIPDILLRQRQQQQRNTQ